MIYTNNLTEEKNLNVKLSNPIKTRAIASAKIKIDKLDAVKLANLLRGDYISECYVPDTSLSLIDSTTMSYWPGLSV